MYNRVFLKENAVAVAISKQLSGWLFKEPGS